MGANGSSEEATEAQPTEQPGEIPSSDPNFRFLMGKVKNIAPAAQKIFNMGKLYLSADDPEQLEIDKADFDHLFPAAEGSSPTPEQETRQNDAFQLFRPLKMTKPLHHGQTYVQWKIGYDYQASNLLCLQKRNMIYLQPVDEFPDFVHSFCFQRGVIRVGLFELIQGFAQIFFSGIDVEVLPAIKMEDVGWDIASRYHQKTGQKQYLVSDFHPRLQLLLPPTGVGILAFVWTDLFPESYNFVLGEASPKHRSGIFSFGRFPPSTYDPDNPQDLTEITGDVVWKLIKVLSHETCHLFGLNHCEYFHCAMNESGSVGEAMSQPLFLCPVCLRKLHQACGFEVQDRYQELLSFLSDVHRQLPCQQFADAITWLQDCLAFLHPK